MKYFWILFIAIVACQPQNTENNEISDPYLLDPNPAGETFNMRDSDSTAIAIADQVMEAMGGRKKWDQTRFIKWNFFGNRDLIWDKLQNRVRIESPRDTTVYLVNTDDKSGKVFKNEQEITDPEKLKTLLEKGYSIWINDSYWLVMPFKLKDSGVTLNFVGEDTTKMGVPSYVLQLKFENVGVTPQNKYKVWVDKSDSLIKQWAFYKEATQDTASAIWPWDNYKSFDGLLLSGDRSDNSGPRIVSVPDSISDQGFEKLEIELN
ncbi:MAG: type II toxin-antitoxin system RelE/ParE family toxin [Cyclobacteriaceae bacterium]|nr:type II toxin-antitoxin system RelE/ParE family toxin [Cyclobacteriaceae bacterium]